MLVERKVINDELWNFLWTHYMHFYLHGRFYY